jgi:hypothetical protein
MKQRWGAGALAIACFAGMAEASFTCESVARRGDLDPDGAAFSNKFDEAVAVNAAGEVLFVGRAGESQQTLYRYPNGGPNAVIARVGDPAPGGSAFGHFAGGCFGRPSVNTAGVAAFFAKLALPGQGVFVDVAGTLEKAAQTTDPAPGGGFFVAFPSVSLINDANEVAFVGTIDLGSSGIFRYDADTDALVGVVDTSDADTAARPFCTFGEVGLSNVGLAFTATVGNPTCLTPLPGVFRESLGTFVPVAVGGDASPIGGSTYESFSGAPEVGAAITFQARVTGVTFTGDGIFETAGPSKVVAAGDAAPEVLGAVKKLGGQHRQALGGDVIVRLFLRQTAAKHGIFRYDATPEAAVVKTDAPPDPPFGPLSRYRAIGPPAAAATGTTIAFRAKMRDTIKPGSKTGVLRCS